MNLIKIISVGCLFWSITCTARVVECPRLPLYAQVGEALDDSWKVTDRHSEIPSVFYLYYLKVFSGKLEFKHWETFESVYDGEEKDSIISCCSSFGNNDKVICASKKMVNEMCEYTFNHHRKEFSCE